MNSQNDSEQKNMKPHPIFCFQEVSQTMNSHLAVFFHQKNYFYHFVSYEGHSSGYMGVAIAFPAFAYRMEKMRILNLANTKHWNRPLSSPPASTPSSPLTTDDIDGSDDNEVDNEDNDDNGGSDILQSCDEDDSEGSESQGDENGRRDDDDDEDGELDLTLIDKADHEFENERRKRYWSIAQMKQNKLLFVRLTPRVKDSTSTFCIATYHMPATYKIPEVMLIHAKLLKNQVAKLAQSDPYIIAGDFNFTPTSSCYSLFTTCTLSHHHLPNLPLPVDGIDDKFTIIGGDNNDGNEESVNHQHDEMSRSRNSNNHYNSAVSLCSAYMVVNGEEPKFTNFAHPDDRNQFNGFQGTLDYLFYNPEKCRAIDVLPIPDLDQPIPSADEPSDHVMIGATFILSS